MIVELLDFTYSVESKSSFVKKKSKNAFLVS